jgi:hypothetical protein
MSTSFQLPIEPDLRVFLILFDPPLFFYKNRKGNRRSVYQKRKKEGY